MNAAVRCEPLGPADGAPMGAFARALRSGTGEALRFLPALPRDAAGWTALVEEAATRSPRLPAHRVQTLVERQRALGAGPVAEANAALLGGAEGPTLAVVTGQQPGLFGGPLLTYHKVAGAVALARRLDGLAGCRVVPVFWLASEDHDFAEANRSAVVDSEGQVRALKVATLGDGRSIVDLPVVRAESDAVLEALAALLPSTERGQAAAALARREGAEDFATWSVRTLLRVFGDAGVVVVEPDHLAPDVGPTLGWLLDHAEPICEAVHACGESLRSAGLPAPLWPQPEGATPLFYREKAHGKRLRVGLGPQGAVRLRDEATDLTRADLRALLLANPARGSGNAIGRVFVQNRHLPVLAYVAGPSEIAYHAQLRAAHQAVGAPFPLAVPRPEATWVVESSRRTLAAAGRRVQDVLAGAREVPRSEDAALTAGLAALEVHLEQWPEAVEALRGRGGRSAAVIRRALTRLAGEGGKAAAKIRAAFEADAGIGPARWQRVMNWFEPQGKPQERVLSPLALVARYGLDAVRAGLRDLDPLPPVHHVLHLGEEDVSA